MKLYFLEIPCPCKCSSSQQSGKKSLLQVSFLESPPLSSSLPPTTSYRTAYSHNMHISTLWRLWHALIMSWIISPQCSLLSSSSLRTVSVFFLFNVSLTICPVYIDAQQKNIGLFLSLVVRIVLRLVPYIGLPESRVWDRELPAESLLGSSLWRYTCQKVRRQDWAEEVVIPQRNCNWGLSTYHKGRGWDIHSELSQRKAKCGASVSKW